jgi:hypothetical protein
VSQSTARTGYLPRLGLGFIAACLSAVGLYGVLRIVQAHLFPEANPATVIWSAHAGYYWRCLTVTYAGVMVGFLAYGAAKWSPEKVARTLVHALPVVVAVILYQGLMVP